jgi:hypothetical protein
VPLPLCGSQPGANVRGLGGVAIQLRGLRFEGRILRRGAEFPLRPDSTCCPAGCWVYPANGGMLLARAEANTLAVMRPLFCRDPRFGRILLKLISAND